jgi:hypothetical protein
MAWPGTALWNSWIEVVVEEEEEEEEVASR